MERLILLASDVDHTLLGDDAALEQFAAWFAENRQSVRLAYNSGRFPDSLWESIRTTGLPEPDALIGGVGTEIFLVAERQRLADWPSTSGDWDPDVIRAALSKYRQLEPQPAHLQSDFKISYYGHDLDKRTLDEMRREMADSGQAANIVYSSQRDLDLLPASADKGTAVAHLARHWNIRPHDVIVAGDSGNDLAMFQQGFRGILVGNAHPDLIEQVTGDVYRAEGHCAAGVLEGLRHWAK